MWADASWRLMCTTVTAPSMYCRGCWYVLDGLPLHRCPECGRTFDPTDEATYHAESRQARLARRMWYAGWVLLAVWIPVVALPSMSRMSVHRCGGTTESGALARVHAVEVGLEMYRNQLGDYPSTSQGLQALVRRPPDVAVSEWTGPYIDLLHLLDAAGNLVDPWGNTFRYARLGRSDRPHAIWSPGPDGRSGTSDDRGTWQ